MIDNRDYQMTASGPGENQDEPIHVDAALSQWDPWLVQLYIDTLARLSRQAIH